MPLRIVYCVVFLPSLWRYKQAIEVQEGIIVFFPVKYSFMLFNFFQLEGEKSWVS